MDSHSKKFVVVTGLSGAGMTSALKDLEDFGYEVFDNFPLSLIDHLAGGDRPVAAGIDARARGFDAAALKTAVERLGAYLVFITADEAVLHKRFTQTRRRHPLAKDRPVAAGIKREQELLYPLRPAADLLIDTTDLSVHDLKRLLEGHFRTDGRSALTVTLMSFGFRFGLPREADMVFDVRFLKNPYWDESLRPLTGLDEPVGTYVTDDPAFDIFLQNVKNMIDPLLPLYAREGKSYLTIAIGCTGGHHRSVVTIEKMKTWLETQGLPVTVLHRDIER